MAGNRGYRFNPQWLHRRYVEQQRTIQEMAREAGVNFTTIWSALKRHNIPLRGKGSRKPKAKLTPEQVTEVQRLYSQGDTTYRALATRFGVCHQAIAYIVNKAKKNSNHK